MKNGISLACGKAATRLLPHAGGRVSSLQLVAPGGRVVEVLHPYPEDFFDPIRWAKGGIYPLMPYSNRIENAQLRVGGETISLAPHPDALPHTLHGNAHAQAWVHGQAARTPPDAVRLADASPGAHSAAILTLNSPASPAWPWAYVAQQQFELSAAALAIRLTLTNTGDRPMPAGMGLHPYFKHHPSALLQHKAATYWPANSEFFPKTPRKCSVDVSYAVPRTLPTGTMTDYFSDWDGQLRVQLPGGDWLHIDCDPVFGHFVVHRPPESASMPPYLCLEPVSHVTNAFNLSAGGVAGTGSRLLAPGESMSGEIRFSVQ